MRVQRIRGGEHTWQIVVAATDDTAEALRAALALARELDHQLTTVYFAGGKPAKGGTDDLF